MPRQKEKDYQVVSLSMSKAALTALDKIRGNVSRTEFIEHLIFTAEKDKADLITENYELKKRVKELEDRVRELQNIIDIQKAHERLLNEQLKTEGVYEKLLEVYRDVKLMFEGIGPHADFLIAQEIITRAKKMIKEYGKGNVKEALQRLFEEKGLNQFLNLVEVGL